MVLESQTIFSNREIAIGIWFLVGIVFFSKIISRFLKVIIPILFCRRFIVFCLVFLIYFIIIVYLLYLVGFWNAALFKDTLFWIVFSEFPLFAKTIKEARDNHFFKKIIKNNIKLSAIYLFVFKDWSFGLNTEMIIVPVTFFIGCVYAIAAGKKKYENVKLLLDKLMFFFVTVIIISASANIMQRPLELLNINTLKRILLPIILLILNLPIVYGLALYNTYEQVFIRLKGNKSEIGRMQFSIFKFAGFYLYKIEALRNNSMQTITLSITDNDIKTNLKKLEDRLSKQIGDNYMKRANFYITWCISGIVLCIIGIVFSNSQVSVKDILTFNFTLDGHRIKEIITYISSTGVAVFACLLLYAIGFKKKKYEEISQIKRYSLHGFLYLIKRQYGMLQAIPTIDDPKELFTKYISIAYELKLESDHILVSFENLLSTGELDIVKQLQMAVESLVYYVGIDEAEISKYNSEQFNEYFAGKKTSAKQNSDVNIFSDDIQQGIKEYSENIKLCVEEFKHYM